ncbi:MAG: hemA [Phycisphaerales bacterium]|nr:hemA [Phycisphaerales bacterium]
MQRLLLLGLNHASAPLAVREKVTFAGDARDRAVDALRLQFPQAEIALLSTCNRVEIYAARETHGHPRAEEMIEFLANFHGIDAASFSPHLYQKTDTDVVAHLFTVASSLDSMVLGETQILGQVRDAYDAARERGATGALLNPLFQRALAAGKEVLSATAIGEGRVSVASVAVDYARRIFDSFSDKVVLSIGGGEMAALVLQSFAQLAPRRLLICNRSPERAAELALKFNGQAVPFENLSDHLTAADIVVSSTGASQPIITARQVAGLRKAMRYRPIFLIDIALPRDVEPGVGEIENVYLYNIDDLQQVVSGTMEQRKDAVEAARAIVTRQVDGFLAWHRAREMGPMIDRLSKRYHLLATEELARTLNKMPNIGDAEKAHLEELTRRIVNKLLHDPITMLRRSEGLHGTTSQYLHALERLFQLNPDGDGSDNADGEADLAQDA